MEAGFNMIGIAIVLIAIVLSSVNSALGISSDGNDMSPSLCSSPPNFPTAVSLEQSHYKNWAQQIELKHVWTATPRHADDVVALANWALDNGYNIRPRGFMHNWSPLVVTGNEGPCSRVILVDTTKFLTSMKMVDNPAVQQGGGAVQVETGASMNSLLTFLESIHFGILGHPAPGDITVGGVVAVGGHGAGVTIDGQVGHRGTASHLILSINAVVWNEDSGLFEIRTFSRSDPDTRAILVNLGRIFMTEVTLEVSPLVNLRCVSRTDISADTLFADPKSATSGQNILSSFIDASGSVEVIWFPFTKTPWLKVWTVSPTKPLLSRPTKQPYNYPFTDNIPLVVSNAADQLVTGAWEIAPLFGNLQLTVIATGLVTNLAWDLWGPSKNTLLYVKPTTLRDTANGYALLTTHGNIQLVLHQFTTFYQKLVQSFADRRLYPINGPLEIRVCGLDTGVTGDKFGPPALSALKPVPDHPEFDTAIWIDCLTFPNTTHVAEFLVQVEEFLQRNFSESTAILRPEWTKGFGYTSDGGAWTNEEFLNNFIPNAFGLDDWDFAVGVFRKLDPRQIFTNAFLRELFK